MTAIYNLDSSKNRTGICGATSLVGKEGYAVKGPTTAVVLAADTDNNTGDLPIWVLVRGGAVGEVVEFSCIPGCGVAVIVADASAAVGAKMMVDSAGKFVALSGATKYSSVILDEAVTAAGQIVAGRLMDIPGVGA